MTRTMWDELTKGLSTAIADIREKVVEEPMYGRALNGPEPLSQWPESAPGFGLGSSTHQRDIAPDHDIER